MDENMYEEPWLANVPGDRRRKRSDPTLPLPLPTPIGDDPLVLSQEERVFSRASSHVPQPLSTHSIQSLVDGCNNSTEFAFTDSPADTAKVSSFSKSRLTSYLQMICSALRFDAAEVWVECGNSSSNSNKNKWSDGVYPKGGVGVGDKKKKENKYEMIGDYNTNINFTSDEPNSNTANKKEGVEEIDIDIEITKFDNNNDNSNEDSSNKNLSSKMEGSTTPTTSNAKSSLALHRNSNNNNSHVMCQKSMNGGQVVWANTFVEGGLKSSAGVILNTAMAAPICTVGEDTCIMLFFGKEERKVSV